MKSIPRTLRDFKPKTHLFLSQIGEHNPVISSSIDRWLKQTIKDASIDVGIFKSHSVRGATCSKAAGAGVTTKQIQEAAGWSSEGTFKKFYHRNLEGNDKINKCFGIPGNHTCWYETAFRNVIYKWLRAQSTCMLFGITWGRWSWNINMPPPHTHTHSLYLLFSSFTLGHLHIYQLKIKQVTALQLKYQHVFGINTRMWQPFWRLHMSQNN